MTRNSLLSIQSIVEYGVPPGSVIDPHLFSVYINSLLNKILLPKYDDDTDLFYISDNCESLKKTVEQVMSKVIYWLNHIKLTMNFDKTSFGPFTCFKNHVDYHIRENPGSQSYFLHFQNNYTWRARNTDFGKNVPSSSSSSSSSSHVYMRKKSFTVIFFRFIV